MAYDSKTVLERYQTMLSLPEGELAEKGCTLSGGDCSKHATLGCDTGNCESCCVGVVEVVRQFSERAARLEARSVELTDTVTTADKLGRSLEPSAPDGPLPSPRDE